MRHPTRSLTHLLIYSSRHRKTHENRRLRHPAASTGGAAMKVLLSPKPTCRGAIDICWELRAVPNAGKMTWQMTSTEILASGHGAPVPDLASARSTWRRFGYHLYRNPIVRR